MRCLRHAFRNTPCPDWWRRVLLVAPCHRGHAHVPTPGAVFTSEMISEATIDRIVELLKLTNAGKFFVVCRIKYCKSIFILHVSLTMLYCVYNLSKRTPLDALVERWKHFVSLRCYYCLFLFNRPIYYFP